MNLSQNIKNLYRLQGQIIGNRLFCLNAVFRASFSRVHDTQKQKADAKSKEMQPTGTYFGHEAKHGNSVYLFP
jgi:hypothetical protein